MCMYPIQNYKLLLQTILCFYIIVALLSVYLSKKQLYVVIKNAITVFVSVNIFKKVINIKIKI